MSYAVKDLCEGLIREYLVKKGLHATVEAFNQEQPKHTGSITKREVLRTSLGLESTAAKWKRSHPGAETLPTTLELCVELQSSTGDMKNNFFQQEPPKPSPARTPNRVSSRQADEGPEEASMPEMMHSSRSSSGRTSSQRPMGSPSAGFAFSPEAAPATTSSVTRRVASMALEPSDEDPEIIRQPLAGAFRGGRSAATATSYSSPPEPSFGTPSRAPATPPAQSVPSAASRNLQQYLPAAVPARGAVGGARRGEMLVEDLGEEEVGFEEPLPKAIGRTTVGRGTVAAVKGQPVSPDLIRTMNALLWGAQGQPPPSWKQGFFFNTNPGLGFGLVQSLGGPCGVLAGVQAHTLAALHSPAGFSMTPGRSEQQGALASAITEILWQARMGAAAYIVVPSQDSGAGASGLGYDQMSRSITSLSANSRDALSASVRSALASYAEPGGWGVCLFLFSLLMSRGCQMIQKDMDEPNNSLMGMHGYCTQELVNMIITGQAVSNVFDGNKDLDGSLLHGITRKCKLGLLTLFEWYKYVEVGQCLKTPDIPVWVVCSESHFTVLFSNDARALQGRPPFDLYYYDELAHQEAIIRLSVRPDPKGGWTARVGDSFGDRGKCEGQNIPPLECVIETRWPGVSVNWNGSEPIL